MRSQGIIARPVEKVKFTLPQSRKLPPLPSYGATVVIQSRSEEQARAEQRDMSQARKLDLSQPEAVQAVPTKAKRQRSGKTSAPTVATSPETVKTQPVTPPPVEFQLFSTDGTNAPFPTLVVIPGIPPPDRQASTQKLSIVRNKLLSSDLYSQIRALAGIFLLVTWRETEGDRLEIHYFASVEAAFKAGRKAEERGSLKVALSETLTRGQVLASQRALPRDQVVPSRKNPVIDKRSFAKTWSPGMSKAKQSRCAFSWG